MILLPGSAEEQPAEGGNNHKLMTVLSFARIAPLTVINHKKWFLEGGDRVQPTFQKPNPGYQLGVGYPSAP
jgi:hypothetical protein